MTRSFLPGALSAATTFKSFTNRNYRVLWSANFFSFVSRWMQMTLLIWLVLTLTDSAWHVALVGFFAMVPLLVLGIFFGVLADKFDRKRLLVAAQVGSGTAALVMTALIHFQVVQYWHAYPVILVVGIGWALEMPARRSLMRQLLGRSGATNAVALDSAAVHCSRMVGPALAGLLISRFGMAAGYMTVTLSYLVSILLFSRLQLRPSCDNEPAAENIFQDMMSSLRYVRQHNVLFGVTLVTVVMNLLLFSYMQMVPVIARDVLDVDASWMGILMAADGCGALLGSMIIASVTRLPHHGRMYMGGALLSLVMVLLFTQSHSYVVSFILLFVVGLGIAVFGTMQSTIVMLAARHGMQGRAFGVITLAVGVGPLGALLIGATASLLGPATAVGVNAIAGILLVATAGLLMPSLLRRSMVLDNEPVP